MTSYASEAYSGSCFVADAILLSMRMMIKMHWKNRRKRDCNSNLSSNESSSDAGGSSYDSSIPEMNSPTGSILKVSPVRHSNQQVPKGCLKMTNGGPTRRNETQLMGSHRQQLSHKCVSFREVKVREYERIIGDNPSCTSGPPIRYVVHYYCVLRRIKLGSVDYSFLIIRSIILLV
jgi:hypothetical protein